jgi:dephospho-CoA kinase
MNSTQSAHPVRIIGLTGSIGSGKSTVAAMLRQRGVVVLDADAYARQAAVELASQICQALPQGCVDGQPDRARLAALVFANPDSRKTLEGIIHPYVRSCMEADQQQAVAQGARLVVLDIPLLFESRGTAGLDGVLVVAAPLEERLARVMARSGLTRQQVLAREANQLPQQDKIDRATWVVHNDGSLGDLYRSLEVWLNQLEGIGPKG